MADFEDEIYEGMISCGLDMKYNRILFLFAILHNNHLPSFDYCDPGHQPAITQYPGILNASLPSKNKHVD